jgi:dUTP pyrophosphatase
MDCYVKIFRRTKDVPLPKLMSEGAAGFDLVPLIDAPVVLRQFVPAFFQTGIHLALSPGFEAQVRPRSSLNRKGVIASLGTIDSDYRGDVGVGLINLTPAPYVVHPGDRIAQLVFAEVAQCSFAESESLEDLGTTARGAGGFGSTGR